MVFPFLDLADRVSSRLPFGSGFFGMTTHSPRASAFARPTSLVPSRTITSAFGAARPAITASPRGLTRTTSKLGGTGATLPGSGATVFGARAPFAGSGATRTGFGITADGTEILLCALFVAGASAISGEPFNTAATSFGGS